VLDEAARPAVREDQRDRIRPTTALVHEVDAETVDVGPEVREPVELAFPRPPVEFRTPVRDQVTQIGQVGAVGPARPVDRVGRPGRATRSRRSVSTSSSTAIVNGWIKR
jgi:hypothetical protein